MKEKMLLVSSTWGEDKTFKMIPTDSDCPYQECIYDPKSGNLAIISKIPMKKLTMVPKLGPDGNKLFVYDKVNKKQPIGYKQERIQIDSFAEYYVENEKEIRDFVFMVAQNSMEFDFAQYFKKPIPEGEIKIEKPEAMRVEQ